MQLAIFDIDGTLTDTNEVDERSFTGAFADQFGVARINNHWSDCPHLTDSGLARHIFRKHFGRTPSAGELSRFVIRNPGDFDHLLQTLKKARVPRC